jgi:hypothetical protein
VDGGAGVDPTDPPPPPQAERAKAPALHSAAVRTRTNCTFMTIYDPNEGATLRGIVLGRYYTLSKVTREHPLLRLA